MNRDSVSKKRTAGRSRGTVGQVGLGIMGGAFARHLLDAGFNVVGYDVSPVAGRALSRLGARIARSCADVAAKTRIIITSLPSPAAMEEVYFGKHGIAAGARPGMIVQK